MPDSENVNLSNEMKQAAEHANSRFWNTANPLLTEQVFADGFPDTLCHYTDFHGLLGILQTRSLWATYTQTLNDDTEQEYGLNVIRDYVARFSSGHSPRTLEPSLGQGQKNFACCFCESSELLSMWVSYAKRGGGYCLEFQGATGLLKYSFPPFTTRLPFKMTYGSVAPRAVKSIFAFASQFAQLGDIEASVAWANLKTIAIRFKHPAFSHESEWRLVVPNPPTSTMRFRAGDADIKPYIVLSPTKEDRSPHLPLTKIVFGPTLRQDRVMVETIELMLDRYGYGDVKVQPSGIPYRL